MGGRGRRGRRVIITQRPPARVVAWPKVFSLRTGECLNSAPNGSSGVHVLPAASLMTGKYSAPSGWPARFTQAPPPAAEGESGLQRRLSGYMNPQLATMLDETVLLPDSGRLGGP